MGRIILLFRLAIVTLIIFILQQPLFIFYNHSIYPDVSVGDIFDVILHALSLDLTVVGYILVLPWLFITISYFIKNKHVLSFIFSFFLPIYFVIVSAIITILFVSDTALYEFWKFKIDSTVLNYIDKPTEVMASVPLWFTLLFFTINICLIILISILYIKVLRYTKIEKTKLIQSMYMIPTAAIIFLAIRGGFGAGTACVANAYFSNNQFLNHAAINPNFNFLYSFLHSKNFGEEFRYMDKDVCDKFIGEIYPKKTPDSFITDTLFSSSRPNILLIVWEGCGEQVAQCIGGKENITPGLSEIAEEGVLFTRCYSNSFRTDRGLLSILTGWLGLPTASLMKMPEKYTKLPSLTKTLKDAGYTTDFWYGGDISFTNMGGFAYDNGFEKTISDKDFDYKDQNFSKWGVVDGVLFDKLTNNLIDVKSKQEKPWFTTVLSLSSHEPWEVPYKKFDDNKKNAFAYTDSVIKECIDKLKQSDSWDNTLVIIVSDHGIIIDELSQNKEEELIHIPFILTGGILKQKGIKIDTILNQSDISATILAQLELPYENFVFSRNIFGIDNKCPSAINTSTISFSYIDTTGVSVYDFVGNTMIYESENNNSALRVEKGKAVLQYLYDKTDEL